MPSKQTPDDFPSIALLKYYRRLLLERAYRLHVAGYTDEFAPGVDSDIADEFLHPTILPPTDKRSADERLVDATLLIEQWASVYACR